jgi:hypothetical protein
MKILKRFPSSHPLFWAIIYFIALGIISVILGQDVSWDLRNYHFYNPYMLLTGRFKYDVLPAQIQTFFNPLIDVPFFIAVYYLKLPPIVVGFLMGGLHGLNQWLVHLITYHSLDKVSERYKITLSIAAAITSIFGAAYISELGTSIGDNTTSVFVLAGLFFIVSSLGKNLPIPSKNILLAGLLLGLATGLKLTNALYSISFVVAINFLPNSWSEKLRNLILSILSMAVGFSLTAGYWIILMWTKFANPLFPFFNKIFQSSYIETDVNLQDLRFLPRDIWQWLFYPFYFAQEQTLVAELKFKESRFVIAYILIVSLLSFILYRYAKNKSISPENNLIYTSILGFLLPFYITAYCIWLIKFSIYRYLIVLELITPILILLIVAYFYPKRNPVLLVTLGIFVLILATVKPLDWWRIPWSDNYFSIDRQALVQYQDDVIVLWGGEPVGYVVPYFPSNTRFLRITGNFGLSPHTKMSKIAEEIIDKTPESSLYLLEVNFELKELDREKSKQAALELRKLVIVRNNCQLFITAIEKYSICKLRKISP